MATEPLKIRTTRLDAQSVACPECLVPAGETCRGRRGKPRESQHSARHELAVANGSPTRYEDFDHLERVVIARDRVNARAIDGPLPPTQPQPRYEKPRYVNIYARFAGKCLNCGRQLPQGKKIRYWPDLGITCRNCVLT